MKGKNLKIGSTSDKIISYLLSTSFIAIEKNVTTKLRTKVRYIVKSLVCTGSNALNTSAAKETRQKSIIACDRGIIIKANQDLKRAPLS